MKAIVSDHKGVQEALTNGKLTGSKTGHTPGPWWRDDDGFIAAGNGDTYVTIADADCSRMDIAEREANKNLIASAPELLDKARQVIDWLHENDMDNTGSAGKGCFEHEGTEYGQVTELKAAIEKATS